MRYKASKINVREWDGMAGKKGRYVTKVVWIIREENGSVSGELPSGLYQQWKTRIKKQGHEVITEKQV